MFRLPSRSFRSGFTLIELLISISIVAIISAIGLVSYSQSQIIARDARRKQDLKAIATALELYYQQNGRYPCSGWTYSNDSTNNPWIPDKTGGGLASPPCDGTKGSLTNTYINVLPKDPINTGTTYAAAKSFVYGYFGYACGPVSAGNYFILTAQLENFSDPDAVKNAAARGVEPKACDGNGIWTTYGVDTYGANGYQPNIYVLSNN